MVYALVDPRTGLVLYVGITDSPHRRYTEHLRKSKKQANLSSWFDELRSKKLVPIFVFIDSVPSEKSLEKELEWITHFQKIFPLYNHRKK